MTTLLQSTITSLPILSRGKVRDNYAVGDDKILIVTSDAGYHSAYDHCTAEYLTQAGVKNSHVHLGDVGITGNGHMMMLEKNNQAIAAFMAGWLEENVERGQEDPNR